MNDKEKLQDMCKYLNNVASNLDDLAIKASMLQDKIMSLKWEVNDQAKELEKLAQKKKD